MGRSKLLLSGADILVCHLFLELLLSGADILVCHLFLELLLSGADILVCHLFLELLLSGADILVCHLFLELLLSGADILVCHLFLELLLSGADILVCHLFLELIHPAYRRNKSLVLDESLINDPPEVRALAAIPRTLDGIDNVANRHRLPSASKHLFEGFVQALVIADATTPTPIALDAFDEPVYMVDLPLQISPLLLELAEFLASRFENGLKG
jgi:hypothetical protein